MTFLKPGLIIASSVLVLSACGSGVSTPEPTTKNTVEKPAVTKTSSESTAPANAPEVGTNVFAALPEPYQTADYNRGRRTFKLCQSCHTLNEGGQNLVGPNLYGIFGREIGAVDGFTYSKAVQESDIIWTPEILAEWLESPRNFLPGNKMSFAGVRRPEDRTAVIAYIMAETGYSED